MRASSLAALAPLPHLLLLAVLIALLPLSWLWLRHRGVSPRQRLAALTALTLFLTFDLVVFGAYTRLSDSGLGCPDWPGCYAQASPVGAGAAIEHAQALAPDGPVTWSKAWIEMLHRYLAMTVGGLIVVMTASSWWQRWRASTLAPSPLWPTLTLAWVMVQGAFGAYTVTLKLYPAVVTLHLVGALVLLALLAIQHAAFLARPIVLKPPQRRLVGLALWLVAIQVFLGGWVSTNYAVLACSGFPQCNGSWWPQADFSAGFSVLRELGRAADGGGLPFAAMVAIHWTHRLFALAVTGGVGIAAWQLSRQAQAEVRRFGQVLGLLLLAQLVSGVSNVVLEWPLVAALGHTAGAAALVLTLTLLLARSAQAAPRRELARAALAV
jgi:cytochrome c oxidase assembly protein subunit 15